LTGSRQVLDLVGTEHGLERFWHQTRDVDVFYSRRHAVQETLRTALSGAWGLQVCEKLALALQDRRWGAIRLATSKTRATEADLGRLACALACACGSPFAPLNQGNCVRGNRLRHVDPSVRAPGHRSPYLPDPLHTEAHGASGNGEDYLILACIAREHCEGGETRLLHLDDWGERDCFLSSEYAFRPFPWTFPCSGLSADGPIQCQRSLFWLDNGGLCIRLSPGNAQPPPGPHTEYLRDLQASLNEARSLARFVLLPGDVYLINNRVWVHGREPLKPNPLLSRHMLGVHGTFSKRGL
jgi:protein CsiD